MPSVWIPSLLRHLTGGHERVAVPGKTVRQVVDNLERAYPGLKAELCHGDRLKPQFNVAVDGQVGERSLRDRVAAASEIHFIPAIGGGALCAATNRL